MTLEETPETLDSNVLKANFQELGLEVKEVVAGSIEKNLQDMLGLETLTGQVVATLENDHIIYHLLSPLVTDDLFLSRAREGKYKQAGIQDASDAERIVQQQALNELSFASPNFSSHAKKLNFGLLDLEKLKGRSIPADLEVQAFAIYPQALKNTWAENNREARETVVVPNAIAQLLGISPNRSTNSPSDLAKTVTDGAYGILEINGKEIPVYFAAALDSLGLSHGLEEQFKLKPGEILQTQIEVGQRRLVLKKSPIEDERGSTRELLVDATEQF